MVWLGQVVIVVQYKLFWTEKKIPNGSWSEFQNSSLTPRNQTFNFAIVNNLKRVFWFSHDPGSQTGLAKPNQTKPRHFRPIFRPFWPVFRAKIPKNTVTKLSEHSPIFYTYRQNIFWWSGPWANSWDLEMLLNTCAQLKIHLGVGLTGSFMLSTSIHQLLSRLKYLEPILQLHLEGFATSMP